MTTAMVELRAVDPEHPDARQCLRSYFAELERRSAVPRLETNATLVEAIALYRSAGYRGVPAFNDEPFADHWFEKQLIVTQ
jgi:hypothetical protein